MALICSLVSALLAAGSATPARASSVTVHDARGRDVTLDSPQRIVSIGGALTEILYALGAANLIVGVDSSSLFPPEVTTDKANVGYMRQLSPEGVLGLNPGLVLAISGSGPKETMDVLDTAHVPLVLVPESYTQEGMLEKIRLVARITGHPARGECLATAVAKDLDWLNKLRAKATKPPRVMFVMSMMDGRAMVAGKNTAADEIIKLAGGVNVIDNFDGYKTITGEAVVTTSPEHILTMERGQTSVQADAVFSNPAFALTPAAQSKSFIAMNSLYLLGFGPRTAAAARDLAVRLDPSLAGDAAQFKPASLSVDCRH